MATIRERRPGVWEVRVFTGLDPVTGKPRQVSKTVRAGLATKTGRPPKAVLDVARELEGDARDRKVGGAGRAGTVAALLAAYFDLKERSGLSPKTLHNYRGYAANIIVPALGATLVRRLTAYDLDGLYGRLIEQGKAPATIRMVHAILSGALAQAVKWGWCNANVAKLSSPPAVRSKRVEAPTGDQVRALLAEADKRNPTMGAIIFLAALTGARRGELCALRWSDVDLDAGTVRIARSLLDIPGRLEEKDTKGHQERTLSLGVAGVALLGLYRAKIEGAAGDAGTRLLPDGYVFSDNFDGATPIRPDRVTGFFGRLRDDLGLPEVHFHSLRHFTATTLAARGDISIRTLAGRLGHADPSISLRVYSSFMSASDEEAAAVLGAELGPKHQASCANAGDKPKDL